MGRWRPLLAVGGLLPLCCETVIGAEFDDYSKFPDSDSGALGGASGTTSGGSAGSGAGSAGLAGGGGTSSDASPDVVAQDAANCPALTTPYPDAPYGAEVDDVFPPLQWEGFVNDAGVGLATTKPFVFYSMDDVRKSCKKYALIHNSEFT